ncbi:hypothetical protein IKW75_02990 [Candidatus Saccharibacteria bacterium]|nr:hypothetical protein [Candidatus Saccharibacteria bacterium]
MIEFRSEPEIQKILQEFNTPKLLFVTRKDAGPDEELYFFKDESGNKYGVWARDHMSELIYEATGLKNDFGIEVKNWIKLKKPANNNQYVAEYLGDKYAVFTVE